MRWSGVLLLLGLLVLDALSRQARLHGMMEMGRARGGIPDGAIWLFDRLRCVYHAKTDREDEESAYKL